MVLSPLVQNRCFKDHCDECGHQTEWWLESASVDFTDKRISMRFYCNSCQEHKKDIGWRRIVTSSFEFKAPQA